MAVWRLTIHVAINLPYHRIPIRCQQHLLRISRSRNTTFTLSDDDVWFPGLVDTTRIDSCELTANIIPDNGLSLEWCLGVGQSQLPGNSIDTYAGHSRVHYFSFSSEKTPAFPPRVIRTEVADLDEQALSAFDDVLSSEELTSLLEDSGRFTTTVPFDDSNSKVYVSYQELTGYAGEAGFYRPMTQRQSELTGITTLTWDTHYCAVVSTTDAAGLRVTAHYDYRFMAPEKTIDVNENITLAHYDALGYLISTRFNGTENGLKRGYTLPEDEATPFKEPVTVEDALGLSAGIPVAGLHVRCPLSWMPVATDVLKGGAPDMDCLTEDGYITRLAWRRRHGRANMLTAQPPHILSIVTDRYDSEPGQQLRQTISFSDGLGRLLQGAVRHEGGEAWQRTESGGLVADMDGPVSKETSFRWAVTGRTEYDGKGQSVRTYQPYFLDTWKYVIDDSARQDLFADTHYYDPTGRENRVVTAKGWQRRTLYTPWFVVSEDENDTLE